MPKRYYITTPIYYVNSVPHIGTALTTFAADVTARYQKMRGRKVTFLTGTDENAIKVMEAAQAAGKDPKAFVDEISGEFKKIWKGMKIEFDDFIRTTEPRHVKCVHEFFNRLKEKGYIYLGDYEGWYDVSSETFYKESELVDGKSPEGNPVRKVKEKNWFFKLSEFQKPLLEHIEKNPKFILPEARKNEVVAFARQGLRDLCISRINPGWGIPVPGDPERVVYVWFDALINYVAATGWPNKGWEELWPAEVEWMGKDILTRFHATLWPAMLMGVGLPLPETLVGHAWLMIGGEKISKSKGNVVPPLELAAELSEKSGCTKDLAIDAVRYYMGATLPFENDSVFTHEDFERRYNSDLANDLGNALNRSLSMAHKFTGGTVPKANAESDAQSAIQKAKADYEAAMTEFRIERAVSVTWELVRFLNKYIDTRAPWALAKANDASLPAVIVSMLLCLRTAEGLVRPLMPSTADSIAHQLGQIPLSDWPSIGKAESLPAGKQLNQPEPMFPRIETKVEGRRSKDEAVKGSPITDHASQTSQSKISRRDSGTLSEQNLPKGLRDSFGAKSKMETPNTQNPTSEITIDDFSKVKLRVARILEAEPVEGADKLLKLQIMVGDEKRQLVAGIRKDYEPMDLIGRQIVVVANLKPATLRGVESQGMLLAATDENGGAILLQPDREAPEGAPVK